MSDLQSNHTQTMSDPGYFHNNNNGSITNNNNVSSTTIPLKEWTRRAVQSINASSSNNTYLSSALTIAKSLVDQICSTYEQQQQQQQQGTNIFGGWDDQLQFHQQQPQHPSFVLPTPGSNCSDYIICLLLDYFFIYSAFLGGIVYFFLLFIKFILFIKRKQNKVS